MIEITQADFKDWKSNKVTKAFLQAAKERADDCKEMLATSAGIDVSQDRFYVGMIHAYREMQEFRMEEF